MTQATIMGRYCPGSSVLHRTDPRTKILLTLLLATVAFLVEDCLALFALLLFVLAAAVGAGRPLAGSLRGLRPVLYLAGFAVVFGLLLTPGEPVAGDGPLRHLSRAGVSHSATMVLRLLLLASGTSLLTFTTSPLALMAGLEKLLQPLQRIGVAVPQIALMLVLALRFIPTLAEEGERIVKAQSCRSAALSAANPLRRARSCLPLLVPLFVATLRRGEELATAMEARGYQGGEGRTRMRPLAFSGADLASAATVLVVLAALLLVEYRRYM